MRASVGGAFVKFYPINFASDIGFELYTDFDGAIVIGIGISGSGRAIPDSAGAIGSAGGEGEIVVV